MEVRMIIQSYFFALRIYHLYYHICFVFFQILNLMMIDNKNNYLFLYQEEYLINLFWISVINSILIVQN